MTETILSLVSAKDKFQFPAIYHLTEGEFLDGFSDPDLTWQSLQQFPKEEQKLKIIAFLATLPEQKLKDYLRKLQGSDESRAFKDEIAVARRSVAPVSS